MNTPDDQGFLGRGWSFPPRFLAAGAEVGMVAGTRVPSKTVPSGILHVPSACGSPESTMNRSNGSVEEQ